jgi:hypothetical protein
MPFEVTLPEIPGGYTLSTAKAGEMVKVATREFLSSEDGDDFIRRLEGFPNIVLSHIPLKQRPLPSQIDHLLVIIRKDKTATLYVNELQVLVKMLKKRDLAVGELVFNDDIADIKAVKFSGVEVPPDAGVLYIFSAGWRKGIFYDFSPIQPRATEVRDFDLGVWLGQFLAYLIFQDRLKISDIAWERLFSYGWFPFISLPTVLARELINYAQHGWNIDDLLPKVTSEIKAALPKWQIKWSKKPLFADHLNVLKTAIERFNARDFISTVLILYPRIEGIMRSYHLIMRPAISQTQTSLVETAIGANELTKQPRTLLLPEKFRQYLTDIYFGAFDPQKPEGVSRHTVAHGVASQDALSEKAAEVGLLILDQLSYYFA